MTDFGQDSWIIIRQNSLGRRRGKRTFCRQSGLGHSGGDLQLWGMNDSGGLSPIMKAWLTRPGLGPTDGKDRGYFFLSSPGLFVMSPVAFEN